MTNSISEFNEARRKGTHFFIAWFGVPKGRRGTLTHIVASQWPNRGGRPLCGATLGERSQSHYCRDWIPWDHEDVECLNCRRIAKDLIEETKESFDDSIRKPRKAFPVDFFPDF